MERVIGNQEAFAIQYEIITAEYFPFIYGKICYWIDNKLYGDYEHVTIISDVYCSLTQIVKDGGNREHKEFFEMKKEKIKFFLGGYAYEYDEYVEKANEEMWARFNIRIDLDVFRDNFAVLIDGENCSRIVYVDNDSCLKDFYLERGIVDKVLYDFFCEFDDFYEKCLAENKES